MLPEKIGTTRSTQPRRKTLRRVCLNFRYLKASSYLETYFVPTIAFFLFLWFHPNIQILFQTPIPESKAKKELQRENRDDLYEEQAFGQHGAYITEKDIAFQMNVLGCIPPPATQSNRRAERLRKNLPAYDALFLICSAASNAMNRKTMRQMYSVYKNTQPYRIKTVFLLGKPKNISTQTAVESESLRHGDILQGNFAEHYYNLTYKTVMGYRWAQLHCPDVTLVLKIDDDVFVDVFRFFDYFLPAISIRQRTIYGYRNLKPRVHREGKFLVKDHEYSGPTYPEFCSGFFVVTTRDVIKDIFEVSRIVRYFRLEDVFTYGMVREAMVDVQLAHLDVITHEWLKYRDCVDRYKYRCKYFAAQLPPNELLDFHSRAMEHRRMLGLSGGITGDTQAKQT